VPRDWWLWVGRHRRHAGSDDQRPDVAGLFALVGAVGTLAGVGVTEAGALGLDFFLTMQIRGWQCKSVWDEGKLDGSFRKLEGHLVTT